MWPRSQQPQMSACVRHLAHKNNRGLTILSCPDRQTAGRQVGSFVCSSVANEVGRVLGARYRFARVPSLLADHTLPEIEMSAPSQPRRRPS